MYQPAGDARDEQLVVDVELHDRVKFLITVLEHPVELFGLRYRTWESVKNEPVEIKALRQLRGTKVEEGCARVRA